MKERKLFKRVLSLVIVLTMLMAFVVPTSAAETSKVSYEKVSEGSVPGNQREYELPKKEEPNYADTDIVRVSIVLVNDSTIEKGYDTENIADNNAAMAYRGWLEGRQKAVTKEISGAIGRELDVVWNLTLAANIISANVEYGMIAAIKEVDGVSDVIIENEYQAAAPNGSAADPNMAISTGMTGANLAWQSGYTGAGTRIAIVDTGLDIQHQSFNEAAFLHALEEDAARAEMTLEEYIAQKDLLDTEEIGGVLSKLNAYRRYSGLTAESLYISAKIAYGFNYVDSDLDVTHARDKSSPHGSHVAGIAAANRYLSTADGFADAMDEALMTGNAPDAQVLVMKVFGKKGGAYDSDYMAAIEDAILLGCDTVNLSLGGSYAGLVVSDQYQSIMDELAKTSTVVVISAGNNSYWSEMTTNGYLYADDVNYHTGGSPGTYANAFTVGSVDNQGFIAPYIQVGDVKLFYNESAEYGNAPIASLANGGSVTLDYVFIDGIGLDSDYTDIDLAGKVVFCQRGEIDFTQKANTAAGLNAKAVIIYDNQPGNIGLNLTGYAYTAPVVAITQYDGAAVRALSEPQTTDSGTAYFTGKITISSKAAVESEPNDFYVMSDFSSWGVPGDLTMKPEVSAPGGNIYSLNGENAAGGGHDQYMLMSGTSMAAPQITGLTALMMQYIEENGLSQDGITDRALAQSLLMSTAVPMWGSAYGSQWIYPVFQQGAGLANISDAMGAATYVLMEGAATQDGKVKAELGDDPDRKGVYTFTFSLNNLTDEVQTYTLDADVFTQDLFMDRGGNIFMDTWTTPLSANVTYWVDGVQVAPGNNTAMYDYDADGDTDKADAQLLMDFLIKDTPLLANADHTDVDGDGDTDTHDVYVLLTLIEKQQVMVPADGSTVVTVTISLTDSGRAFLQNCENGGYVQAYVYADPVANAEGAVTTGHAIPVLAFYGSWSEASMFDKGSAAEYFYGLEDRAPYLYAENGIYGNAFIVDYGTGESYLFAGNPYGDGTEMDDSQYLEARNALNNLNGNAISDVYYSLIRNAGAGKVTVTDTQTGEVYMEKNVTDFAKRIAAFYVPSEDIFGNSNLSAALDWSGTDRNGAPLAEGTTVELALVMAPEYYVNLDGSVDWDALDDGAKFTTTLTIDNTAPQILGDILIDEENGTLSFTASDNRHIAVIALYEEAADGSGDMVDYLYPDQLTPGESLEAELGDMLADGVYLLEISDYACNTVIYRVFIGQTAVDEVESISVSPEDLTMVCGSKAQLTATLLPVELEDRTVTWSSDNEAVAVVDENGVVTAVGEGQCSIIAVSNLDPTFTASCTVTVLIMPVTIEGVLQNESGVPMCFTWNMETDKTWTPGIEVDTELISATYGWNDKLYIMDGESVMHRVNMQTGETEAVADPFDVPLWDMACSLVFANGASPLVSGIYGTYFLPEKDPMALDASAFDLSQLLAKYTGARYLTAIASGGYDIYEDKGTEYETELYFLLDAAGYMWAFWIYPTASGWQAFIDIIPTDLPTLKYNPSSDIMDSLVAGEDGYLYLAHFDGNTDVIYRLELTRNGFHAERAGDVGKDVWPAALYYASSNESSSGFENLEAAAINTAAITAQTNNMESLAAASGAEAEESISAGSTNSVATVGQPVEADPEAEVEEDTLIITVTGRDVNGDVDSHNGRSTVTYDPEAMTLQRVVVKGDVTSYVQEDGSVTFGYASLEAIPAGDAVAILYFKINDQAKSGATITHEEVNNDHLTDVTEELTHTFQAVVTAPTCTEKGYTTYTCTTPGCGYTYVDDYVDALGHDFGEWVDTKPATCTDKGEQTRTCSRCQETETRETDALGHDYKDVVTKPTTTEKGYTTHTCTRCGHSYVDSYVDPLDPDNSKTGDSFPVAAMIVLLVISLGGVAVLVVSRKKWFRK